MEIEKKFRGPEAASIKTHDETKADGDEKLIAGIIGSWREKWKDIPGDGIYFQTFTETNDSPMGGETVAERAVRLVNRVVETMFRESPGMKIVFGLHATSVKNHLPTMLTAELFWDSSGSAEDILERVLNRKKADR